MKTIQTIRESLHLVLQERLARGFYLHAGELEAKAGQSWALLEGGFYNYQGGVCIVGALSAEGDFGGYSRRQAAKAIGITVTELLYLEEGFEGLQVGPDDREDLPLKRITELYDLGREIAREYGARHFAET